MSAPLVAGNSFVSYVLPDSSTVPALVEAVNGALASLFVFDPAGYFRANSVAQSTTHTVGTWDYTSQPVQQTAGISGTTTTPYTLAVEYALVVDATAGNKVVNLPTAASSKGREYIVKKKDVSVNTVTLTPAGSEKIDGASTKVLTTQYNSVHVISDGATWQVISAAIG